MQEITENKVCLENKRKLSMTGIKSVDGFSEQYLKLTLSDGRAIISGEKIKITSYNNQLGNLSADGLFSEIKFINKSEPFIKKLFK